MKELATAFFLRRDGWHGFFFGILVWPIPNPLALSLLSSYLFILEETNDIVPPRDQEIVKVLKNSFFIFLFFDFLFFIFPFRVSAFKGENQQKIVMKDAYKREDFDILSSSSCIEKSWIYKLISLQEKADY